MYGHSLVTSIENSMSTNGAVSKVGTAQISVYSVFVPVLFLITFIDKLSNTLGEKNRDPSFLVSTKVACSFPKIFQMIAADFYFIFLFKFF